MLPALFGRLVQQFKPKPKTSEAVQRILLDIWKRRQDIDTNQKIALAKEITGIDEKLTTLTERITNTQSPALIRQYETEIEKLLQQKEALDQRIKKQSYSESNFAPIQSVVVKHLENPSEMWETKVFSRKRLLLAMYFSRGLIYDRNSGFQTPEIPLIVKVLNSKYASKKSLVEMAGVKPASKTRSSSNHSQD